MFYDTSKDSLEQGGEQSEIAQLCRKCQVNFSSYLSNISVFREYFVNVLLERPRCNTLFSLSKLTLEESFYMQTFRDNRQ